MVRTVFQEDTQIHSKERVKKREKLMRQINVRGEIGERKTWVELEILLRENSECKLRKLFVDIQKVHTSDI